MLSLLHVLSAFAVIDEHRMAVMEQQLAHALTVLGQQTEVIQQQAERIKKLETRSPSGLGSEGWGDRHRRLSELGPSKDAETSTLMFDGPNSNNITSAADGLHFGVGSAYQASFSNSGLAAAAITTGSVASPNGVVKVPSKLSVSQTNDVPSISTDFAALHVAEEKPGGAAVTYIRNTASGPSDGDQAALWFGFADAGGPTAQLSAEAKPEVDGPNAVDVNLLTYSATNTWNSWKFDRHGETSLPGSLSMAGEVAVKGNGAHSIQITAFFRSTQTHTIATLGNLNTGLVAMATIEYTGLYSYAGNGHCSGIKIASTRRISGNTDWRSTKADAAFVGDDSIAPVFYWEEGVLYLTVGSSVQITGVVRITSNTGSITRNFAAV